MTAWCQHAAFRRGGRPHGSVLVFVLVLILVLAVAGTAVIRRAGADRESADRMGKNDRGLACAEAGLQYARRFFGTRYESSNGWNTWLADPSLGYRFDPGGTRPTLANLPLQVRGASNGTQLDPGADVDGDGVPDFWVSIRDDDDERPFGLADNPARDNNEMIVLRSECTNPKFARTHGGQPVNVVLESTLTHIQGGSGYGTSGPTNASDLVGGVN